MSEPAHLRITNWESPAVRDLALRSGRAGLFRSVSRQMARYRNRFYFNVGSRNRVMTRRRQAYGRSRSQLMSRTKKRVSSNKGVTTQRDSRLIYAKKRMSRIQRKRWTGFKRKVNAVAEKDFGSQTVVFNQGMSAFSRSANSQIAFDIGLYTGVSTNNTHNDMRKIGEWVTLASTDALSGLDVQSSSKVLFQSGILDFTLRNDSYLLGAAGPVQTAECKLEVDIYEVSLKSEGEDGTAHYNDIVAMLNNNWIKTDSIGGAGLPVQEIAMGFRGVTPWDCTYSLSRFGIKIWRKTKYTINVNDQITYQIRDPRRHSIQFDKIHHPNGFNLPGISKFLIIIGKLAPGLTIGTEVGTYTQSMNLGMTRKYMFKVENWSEDRTAYLSL